MQKRVRRGFQRGQLQRGLEETNWAEGGVEGPRKDIDFDPLAEDVRF